VGCVLSPLRGYTYLNPVAEGGFDGCDELGRDEQSANVLFSHAGHYVLLGNRARNDFTESRGLCSSGSPQAGTEYMEQGHQDSPKAPPNVGFHPSHIFDRGLLLQ
jgi:hypothetical protein